MKAIYVGGDARGIQGYIFGSPRLLEMRGASALIDFFDRAAVPALIERHGGRRVFSGGGNFLAVFDGEAEAAGFEAAARAEFFHLTGTSGLAVARLAHDGPFAVAREELGRALRREKVHSGEAGQLAAMPFLKRCESCGREGADELSTMGTEGGGQWIGPICARKREMHEELAKARGENRDARFATRDGERPLAVPPATERLRRARLPKTLRELAGEDGLALVVADGNGLGEWFHGLDRDECHDFSAEVDATLRAALDGAVEAAFQGEKEPSLQVLVCGGDDLVVALPAGRALAFAAALLTGFEVSRPGRPEETAGMAAGLLFTTAGFPFRQAHALAEELLHGAKGRCRDDGLRAALDFHRVTASHVRSMAAEREAVERRDGEGRAWSYGAAGPYSLEELEPLRALAGKLARRVTPSQRGRLREILSPRDDGPGVALEEGWGVPARVIAELETWWSRQEGLEPAFEKTPCEDLLRRQGGGAKPPAIARWKLADALLLAELREV